MKYKFIDKEFTYDGSQLRSLFAYLNYGVMGDSIVSWVGPCQIPEEKIVDGEDLLAGEKIEGSLMLHFIIEYFPAHLSLGVSLQRLLASLAKDYISQKLELSSSEITRQGDDLFFKNRKLSISIATNSPVSTLIHFALNVSNHGTPVSTSSLEDLKLDPKAFADDIGLHFSSEFADIVMATKKVKWVK